VVLCIRGTQSMKDLFTSLTGGCCGAGARMVVVPGMDICLNL
jgi:hypothetical protein